MGLELRTNLKLTQQLVLTPQLQQAIKLLQLSRLELIETINQELMENPFLEEGFDDPNAGTEDLISEQRKTENNEEAYSKEIAQNADWEDYLGDFASTTRQHNMKEVDLEEGLSAEARYISKTSLSGHLMWQLHLSRFTPKEVEIGELIIGNLDNKGYLQSSTEDMAEVLKTDPNQVEQVLARIQLFDPIGVGARTPQECLLIQLKVLNYDRDPILVSLIQDHLDDLESKRYKPLLRKFKIEMEDLKEYLDIIQSLDPLPGANYDDSEPMFVSPDAYVYQYDDDFIIILNDEGLPKLQLSSLYDESMSLNSETEKEYFKTKISSATWLIRSVYQRQKTLYKVLESLIKKQRDFFISGVSGLRPLILKDVADDINMHESTVSRITTNKYVATPHGTFELKFFFNSALSLDDGSEVGSESVKALIKKLIADENPKEPLSDEKIGEYLKDVLKVNIARRTVAKYRTALKIPSSSKRKELL
ncbi:RNA polymerase factor sigma-54 [Desulfovibrio litoralis]|uniref:RNA polymerase, sigma 54 subunit, RpoN/SigL n=1 Tax=Desulfovibrio litoralis DSM 11393 TaxID=1121455 RepID=A0A1M7SG65_9BACT|nr:RNA polymerase factor sigma-54 [Desulfovibrio litoralis]SHN57465.1 RNA polymerase, sigma 54 subunit, RpoN/SigL [Desulfovibrio litoralis DSM 11393]